MFTVTYKDLASSEFKGAFRKLAMHPFKNSKLAYNVARAATLLEQEIRKMNDETKRLITSYAEKDEAGKIKEREGAPGSFTVPEDKVDEWDQKMEDLQKTEVDIPRHKLTLDDLEGVGLSPSEMIALEALIDGEPSPSLPPLAPVS